MITCRDADDLKKLLSQNKIIIYGAGYVASIFLNVLKIKGLEKQVQEFVVSKMVDSKSDISGFLVKPVSDISVGEHTIVCIATHESFKEAIETILIQKGIENYIWVYPFLYEMYLGVPIKEGQWINTKKLFSVDHGRYGIAIRWGAIDHYYGKNQNGWSLYKKAMLIHGTMDTAETRAERFKDLIQNWELFGYQDEMQISINRTFDILDGEHRVALALYHHQDKLKCRVYSGENIHEEKILMTKRILQNGGFTHDELEQLEKIHTYIGREYAKHF